jgi:tetratricopeptide (TPR) repeat protein
MKKLIYFSVFLLFLCRSLPLLAENADASKALSFGKMQFKSGNYEKAKEFFASAINQDPSLYEAYEYRAKSASKIGGNSLDADISFYKSRLLTAKENIYTINFGLACTYLEKMSSDPKSKELAEKELAKVMEKDKDGPFGKRSVELQAEYKVQAGKTGGKSDSSIGETIKGYWRIISFILPGIGLILLLLVIFTFTFPKNRFKSTFAAIIIAILVYILATVTTLTGFGLKDSYGKSIRTGAYFVGRGIHPGK